jgi:hypothetical protein
VLSFYILDFSIEITIVAPIARAAANPLNYRTRLMSCVFVSSQQLQQSCPFKTKLSFMVCQAFHEKDFILHKSDLFTEFSQ